MFFVKKIRNIFQTKIDPEEPAKIDQEYSEKYENLFVEGVNKYRCMPEFSDCKEFAQRIKEQLKAKGYEAPPGFFKNVKCDVSSWNDDQGAKKNPDGGVVIVVRPDDQYPTGDSNQTTGIKK